MKKEFILSDLAEIDTIAKQILADFSPYKIFLLSGDLGAGKTTLTQSLCKQLAVNEEVVSPTYTIINEYRTANNQPIYHADLYRVDNLDDALNTGIEDYLYSGHYCFIEWPQIISEILPFKFVKLAIQIDQNPSNSSRTIIVETNA